MYAITGATGNVGRRITAALHADGAEVRALTRRPDEAALPTGVDVRYADLLDPDGLAETLRGVRRMFVFPVAETARRLMTVARDAGVERVVVLSSGAVTAGMDDDFHLPVERAAEESGMEWTHVRPGEFAMNKLWLWGPSIRAERVVRDPNPDAAWYPVHEADIADVALAALREDGHAGRAYTVSGPELISHREQVAAIAAAIGEPVEFVTVSPRRARELYLAQGGFAAANAEMLLGFTDYGGHETDPEEHTAAVAEAVADNSSGATDTATLVTGRPARDFAAWARDHAADFV